MRIRKVIVLAVVLFTALSFTACENGKTDTGKDEKLSQVKADVYEDGYNLPVDEARKMNAEEECIAVLKQIQDIYRKMQEEENKDASSQEKLAGQMMEKISQNGYPVSSTVFLKNMKNDQKVDQFLTDSLQGKAGQVTTYEVHSGGELGRREFIYDGEEMYVLFTNTAWNEEENPVIRLTTYTRIEEWEYTDKGWFCYELCVPKPPEVSEIFDGNAMLRVKPQNEEYMELTSNYLRPVGYQGNNLLWTNWDAGHLEKLDFNALYEYFYLIEYGQRFEPGENQITLPKECGHTEFTETILTILKTRSKASSHPVCIP